MQADPFRLVDEDSSAGWVDTSTARAVADALDQAAMLGAVALVTGPSGAGKSAAVMRYAELRERVFVTDLSIAESGLVPSLAKMSMSMGLGYLPQYGAAVLARMIRDKLHSGALLIIDNAENLSRAALLLLGSFTDGDGGESRGAVALVGRERLHPLIYGPSRSHDMEGLQSRIGAELLIQCERGIPDEDIAAFAHAFGVFDADSLALLRQAAQSPRAPNRARVVTRLLSLARSKARGGAIRAAHVRQAAAALSGRTID